MTATRFAAVLAAIDSANSADPRRTAAGEAVELVYGRRMAQTLGQLAPDASELLRIAVRGQHIERWTSPRDSYPQGRVGYLKWRAELKDFHARRVGEIMAAAGYDSGDIARVAALIRKEKLKYDAEAQTLEDVACIVFLENYFAEFSKSYDDIKVIGILRKTWAKMSPAGHAAALALDMPPRAAKLVEAALAGAPDQH
ncbi:MAG TPA: DUF4202 domain-containing protein [Hyphomicrobiales bacterium]|nr:DUF4202 domain-containing protein [Rhodobiaceae bacterium]HXK53336.1 DUF4202 domain-containing protein [Hyphomicrobiales bacterium]